MKHLFLSYRANALSTWQAAFPQAEIHLNIQLGMILAGIPREKAVIWLHTPPGTNQMEDFVSEVRKLAPHCPVVVLSNVPSESEGLRALAAGAMGYCNALAIPEVLMQVAGVVQQGGLWVGPDLIKRLFSAFGNMVGDKADMGALSGLSPREAQVAQAVARGSTNKEIALAMRITERTVKAHLSAIFDKLGVRDRMQLSLIVNGVEQPSPLRQKIAN